MYDESTGNWQTYERAGMAMLIGGGVALVAGTVIYIVNRGKPAESSSGTQVASPRCPIRAAAAPCSCTPASRPTAPTSPLSS